MTHAHIARQPIFDCDLTVVGYELLFRDGPARAAAIASDVTATAHVALNAMTELGLERLTGGHRAWINVSREFLLSGLVETLPADRVGLEILEGQFIDDLLVATVARLTNLGYHFALDDFVYTEAARPLLELVDVVKLDLLALGRDGLAAQMRLLAPFGIVVLAEKVETPEDHAFCRALGCNRFQGYFYCKPELLSERRIEVCRVSLMQVLAALLDPSIELCEVERLIAHDVSVSLRLLRYINSAFFGLRHRIATIRQAITLLGGEKLKRWATLSVFAGVDHKPSELTRTALTRARFCELAAVDSVPGAEPAALFTMGLFSVLDALLDTPIEEALRPLPFPDEMRAALVQHAGAMGALLDAALALESGDFDRAETRVPDAWEVYSRSMEWADRATRDLFDDATAIAA